jgi:hypothetical protein
MSKIIFAKSWAHKGLSDMKRKDDGDYDIASASVVVNHPELGRCYVGSFVCGIGAFHVHFPADAVRIATADELDKYTKGRFASTFAPPFQIEAERFATITDLDEMPVDPDWQKYS